MRGGVFLLFAPLGLSRGWSFFRWRMSWRVQCRGECFGEGMRSGWPTHGLGALSLQLWRRAGCFAVRCARLLAAWEAGVLGGMSGVWTTLETARQRFSRRMCRVSREKVRGVREGAWDLRKAVGCSAGVGGSVAGSSGLQQALCGDCGEGRKCISGAGSRAWGASCALQGRGAGPREVGQAVQCCLSREWQGRALDSRWGPG
ncbi:hypothetical protein J0A71_03g07420 [Encephalitozoon cuniculi]|nr:hypothetical protein J0A71_03g07420 [Encephalitozoon cuniculi]